MTAPESRRMAKIYFRFEFGQMAKNMAANIRSQSSFCNIVDAAHFQGPEHVDPCNLVMIQKSSSKAKLIATCYEKFGSDGVQIVFFDDDGQVVQENDETETVRPEAVSAEPEADSGLVPDTDTAEAGTDPGAGGHSGVQEGDSEGDDEDSDASGLSGE